MPCTPFRIGNATGFVCTPPRRCACKRRATRQCDWKVPTKKSGTCDRWICDSCTHQPAPEKDLCPAHAAEWKARAG
jgi:hypothetical protein